MTSFRNSQAHSQPSEPRVAAPTTFAPDQDSRSKIQDVIIQPYYVKYVGFYALQHFHIAPLAFAFDTLRFASNFHCVVDALFVSFLRFFSYAFVYA